MFCEHWVHFIQVECHVCFKVTEWQGESELDKGLLQPGQMVLIGWLGIEGIGGGMEIVWEVSKAMEESLVGVVGILGDELADG